MIYFVYFLAIIVGVVLGCALAPKELDFELWTPDNKHL